MNILNPNYNDPVMTRATQLTAQITTYFANHTNVQSITGDQIRTAFPANAAELNDAMISQIAQQAGWKVTL